MSLSDSDRTMSFLRAILRIRHSLSSCSSTRTETRETRTPPRMWDVDSPLPLDPARGPWSEHRFDRALTAFCLRFDILFDISWGARPRMAARREEGG